MNTGLEPNIDTQTETTKGMLSRIADSLFWLNRYMERVDGMLRLVYIHYILSMDKQADNNRTWKPVLELFTTANQTRIANIEDDAEAALYLLLLDAGNPNSLKSLISKARENARGVQDHITKEVWEEINGMYHLINHPLSEISGLEAVKMIELFTKHSVLYTGITDITMPRGMGWNFMNIGKYIERCVQTIVFTEKELDRVEPNEKTGSDILQWRYLLLSISGYELHLKTYRNTNHNHNLAHQVLLNENFTRSVIYCLNRIGVYLTNMLDEVKNTGNGTLLRYFGRLHSKVQYMELEPLENAALKKRLHEIKTELLEFSHRLAQHFFSYA